MLFRSRQEKVGGADRETISAAEILGQHNEETGTAVSIVAINTVEETKELVSETEILNPVGGEKPDAAEARTAVVLTPEQRLGQPFAYWGAFLLTLVVIAILTQWFRLTPSPPIMAADVKADQAKMVLENYKAVSEIATEQSVKMGEKIGALLLPILTALFGYILGQQKK